MPDLMKLLTEYEDARETDGQRQLKKMLVYDREVEQIYQGEIEEKEQEHNKETKTKREREKEREREREREYVCVFVCWRWRASESRKFSVRRRGREKK